jgi:hypothetical protein
VGMVLVGGFTSLHHKRVVNKLEVLQGGQQFALHTHTPLGLKKVVKLDVGEVDLSKTKVPLSYDKNSSVLFGLRGHRGYFLLDGSGDVPDERALSYLLGRSVQGHPGIAQAKENAKLRAAADTKKVEEKAASDLKKYGK